jgi:hypothetical protein
MIQYHNLSSENYNGSVCEEEELMIFPDNEPSEDGNVIN